MFCQKEVRALEPRKQTEPHKHGKRGGFAANPQLAKEAGRKGGNAIKRIYGIQFYRDIGKIGGEIVKRDRGREFFVAIGHLGGKIRSAHMKKRLAERQATSP